MTHRNAAAILLAATLALLAASKAALADGCAFVPLGSVARDGEQPSVTSPRQECLMATDGKTVRMVLRTHFETASDELAWVVPVPAKPRDIQKAAPELFATLDHATAPTFYTIESPKGSFGCGCAAPGIHYASQAPPSAANAVTVHDQGTAGIYEFVVLSSTGGDELTTWLSENGYALPIGAERVLGRYVEKGWYWLAMRLRKDLPDTQKLVPHPIAYTYDSETLTFPLVISQLSAGLENEILLYVLAPSRYATANWPNRNMSDMIYKPGKPGELRDDFHTASSTPSGTTYEHMFTTATNSRDGRIFITESADSVGMGRRFYDAQKFSEALDKVTAALPTEAEPRYLTRLRTVMPPKTMDRDVLLVPVEWPVVSNYIEMSATQAGFRGETALAGGGIGLLMLGAWPRRRKLPLALRIVLCAAACTILVTL